MVGLISPMIRQVLLHWNYELIEKDLLQFTFCSYENEPVLFNQR